MNEEEKLKNIAYKFGELTNAFLDLANSAKKTSETITFLQEENARLTEKLHRVGQIFSEY